MNKEIETLIQVIELSHQKIKDIQDACPHPSYEVIMASYRPGQMSPSRLCSECHAIMEGITDEESREAYKKFQEEMDAAKADGFALNGSDDEEDGHLGV